MTPAALDACARHIETLETENAHLREACHILATGAPRRFTPICTLCGTVHYARGMCEKHYRAWLKVRRFHARVGR